MEKRVNPCSFEFDFGNNYLTGIFFGLSDTRNLQNFNATTYLLVGMIFSNVKHTHQVNRDYAIFEDEIFSGNYDVLETF